MANKKKKNNVTVTSVKSNSKVLKEGVNLTVTKGKPRQTSKKKVDNKKAVNTPKAVKQTNKNKIEKTPVEVVKVVEEKVLTPEEIALQKKEKNRKKYLEQQKRYREAQKNKNKKVLPVAPQEETKEEVKEQEPIKEEPKVEVNVQETDLVKKTKTRKEKKYYKKDKGYKRKEKRKDKGKPSGLTQTLTIIKEKSVNTISNVVNKTDDKYIPLGETIDEKTKRSKRFIKEAIVYAIILTIIDVLCIIFIDYFNFLRLFDVKALNVVVTVIIALIFNFFVAFMVDYFVTEIWAKKRRKKDGEQDGNNRTFEGKYKEDFKDKERE